MDFVRVYVCVPWCACSRLVKPETLTGEHGWRVEGVEPHDALRFFVLKSLPPYLQVGVVTRSEIAWDGWGGLGLVR